MTESFDIVIVGGGLIGAAFARALMHAPLRIALIEAKQPSTATPSDIRSIGLNIPSQRILSKLDFWPQLQEAAQAIEHLTITDAGHFGVTRLHAKQHGLSALGYVVPMHVLQNVLQSALRAQENLTLFCPARVSGLSTDTQHANLTLDDGRELQARLVIGADGQNSIIRDLLNIAVTEWNYQQYAIVTNVRFNRPRAGMAFERFTRQGALAILPQGGDRYGLIWSVKQAQFDAVHDLDDAAFSALIQDEFSYRLGELIDVGKRHIYPLSMRKADDMHGPRTVLLGNAAQSLHPIAAQGFNLGLRDTASLAQRVLHAQAAGDDIGAATLLDAHAAERQRDRRRTRALTDGLNRIFANQFVPLVMARNMSLLAIDLLPWLKQRLVNKMTFSAAAEQLEHV